MVLETAGKFVNVLRCDWDLGAETFGGQLAQSNLIERLGATLICPLI